MLDTRLGRPAIVNDLRRSFHIRSMSPRKTLARRESEKVLCPRSGPPNLTLAHFMAVRDQLRDESFWEDCGRWHTIADTLPGYRLSKFQPLMPAWLERAIVANYLLDVSG